MNNRIFDHCFTRAHTQWCGDLVRILDSDMSYNYEIEKYQNQNFLVFSVMIFKNYGSSATIYNFAYDTEAVVIQICDNDGKRIHTSEVFSTEEMEARLFQIQSVVDTYDLDESVFENMKKLHQVYLNQNYETVSSTVV